LTGWPDRRRNPRFIANLGGADATLEVQGGRSTGYLADVSACGASVIIPAAEYLRTATEAMFSMGAHKFNGRIVRTAATGSRAAVGIESSVPVELLREFMARSGAVILLPETVAVVGRLTMPVAVRTMRLLKRQSLSGVDLSACTGLEVAGAAFLMIAEERGWPVLDPSDALQAQMNLIGIRHNRKRR